jgi:hypothetical protein
MMLKYNNIHEEEWQDILKKVSMPMTTEDIELQKAWRLENCPDMDGIERYEDKHGV